MVVTSGLSVINVINDECHYPLGMWDLPGPVVRPESLRWQEDS